MNKTAIKNFAIWARVQLIEAAKQRAYEYEITENGEHKAAMETIGGRLLTADEKKQRQQLIAEIGRKGYTQVMEEAAYTWFNRFIALRYMEVNGFLPSKVRVFTDENGTFKPEILKEAMTVEIDGLDRSIVLDLLDKQNNEELYKYLLITQCNALNQGLPYMFEKISNWTELLFPANLLRPDSVIGRMISDIEAADFEEEVEIIGWLYQYYISEKHEEVIDPLHGKIIKKEDIPAATQLFTTDWVVRYILDNSLGRYWLERNPNSQLASKLTYLVLPKDGGLTPVNESIAPEELKVLDPCVGSGHFLSYAFDILLEIYRECGWSDRDAAKSILENNLFGLDIDDRAAQLACFAVAMKARKYNRRILNGETALNILAMQDADFITDDFAQYFANREEDLKKDIQELRIVFNNAKEYGSIISVPKLNYAALYERIDIISRSYAEDIFQMEYQRIAQEQMLPLVKQAEILSTKYDIVATNPPYMNKFSPRLKDYINQHFADYKGDLFSVFMFRNFAFCKENGYSGFMTPNVWMFIKAYEELRSFIIRNKSITTLIQTAKGAFYKEATVDVCPFVLQNKHSTDRGVFFRLENYKGDMDAQCEAFKQELRSSAPKNIYYAGEKEFETIAGMPIVYWANETILNAFREMPSLSDVADLRHGMSTSDNNRFLRLWHEVEKENINFTALSKEDTYEHKWYPILKGGEYRKWYGNHDYVVNWKNDGEEIKTISNIKYPYLKGNLDFVLGGQRQFFREGITWSSISSGSAGFRYYPGGFMFTNKGQTLFCNNDGEREYYLAFLNTKVVKNLLEMLSPTIGFELGYISKLPAFLDKNSFSKATILAKENTELSKKDWDSFETSWDFKRHPLI